jgi:hypothetical protein
MSTRGRATYHSAPLSLVSLRHGSAVVMGLYVGVLMLRATSCLSQWDPGTPSAVYVSVRQITLNKHIGRSWLRYEHWKMSVVYSKCRAGPQPPRVLQYEHLCPSLRVWFQGGHHWLSDVWMWQSLCRISMQPLWTVHCCQRWGLSRLPVPHISTMWGLTNCHWLHTSHSFLRCWQPLNLLRNSLTSKWTSA